MTTLQDNLQAVQSRIAAACAACGRNPAEVTLLAVSKTFGADAVQEVATYGQQDFGENYIQEGVDKITFLQSAANANKPLIWHCIGPIQSNKTKYVAEFFSWAHTVDRLKIAQRLNDQRPEHLPPLNVCLQVNIDAGPTKSGVAPEAVLELAEQVAQLPRLVLRGLMSIPDPVEGFEAQVALHTKARLTANICSFSSALNCTHMLLSFSMPTPCSPVTVPPMATLVSKMSAPYNSQRCS